MGLQSIQMGQHRRNTSGWQWPARQPTDTLSFTPPPSPAPRNYPDEEWTEETEAWRGLRSLPARMGQRHAGFPLCWTGTHQTQRWLLSPEPLLARKQGVKRPQRGSQPPSQGLGRTQCPPFHIRII